MCARARAGVMGFKVVQTRVLALQYSSSRGKEAVEKLTSFIYWRCEQDKVNRTREGGEGVVPPSATWEMQRKVRENEGRPFVTTSRTKAAGAL